MATSATTGTTRTAAKRAPRAPQDRRRKAAAVLAEVDAETAGKPGRVPVPLGEHTLYVLQPGEWRQSTNDALRTSDFNAWASMVLDVDDLATWFEVDPTNNEVGAFVDAAMVAAGFANPGNSSAR